MISMWNYTVAQKIRFAMLQAHLQYCHYSLSLGTYFEITDY